MRNPKIFLFAVAMLSVFLLPACYRILQPDPGVDGVPGFIPPTKVIPSSTPTATLAPEAQETSISANDCQDSLTFVKDETIPDGTQIQAGASIDKRWEVKNSGTCNWDEGYTIQLIGGSDMGVQSPLDLFPARSNASTTIRIQFFAPEEPGNYRSAWQAFNPQGTAFGDPFYIDIVVTD
jgi:hypothetical protein